MLNQIGLFFLILTFFLSFYSFILAFISVQKKQLLILRAAANASLWSFVSSTVSFLLLFYLFYVSDFSNAFVAGHSNFDLPLFYRLTALWAGQEGSLLLWVWILLLLNAIAVKIYYYRNQNMWKALFSKKIVSTEYHNLFPYVLTVVMGNALFFTIANLFGSNPFHVLNWVDANGVSTLFVARDGSGLNPLLQHPAMIIHPPILYVGFVGFVIPFAFAIAALWSKNLGEGWIKTIRRWTITVWLFLTAGIVLGGHWSYVELGWGGYWAWDPVENGSLLPWLTGTAFLHSVIIQEKRGMLKVWNVSLNIMTYLLVIVATLITRSGLISSVHSFARSNVGPLFISFFLVLLAFSVYLVVTRLPLLKSEHKLDSLVSRESSFLYNNLILLTMTFAILWGTIFPLVSEAFTSKKITVGPEFFNTINIPLALLLLLLTGLGPMLAWRKTSLKSLMKNFLLPLIGFIISLVIMLMGGVKNFYALVTIGLSVFVLLGVVMEFTRGLKARMLHHQEFILFALINMMRQNQRRYGGYIVHLGVVIMFIGFAGNAFNVTEKLQFTLNETHHIGKYKVQIVDMINKKNPNYQSTKVKVNLFSGDKKLAELYPEKRIYTASQQPTTEVEIYSTLTEDVYLVFEGVTSDKTKHAGKLELHVWIKPLVVWVWIGSFVILFGIIIALLPGLRAVRANASGRSELSQEADLSLSQGFFLSDLRERKDSLLRNIKDLDLDWDMGKFDQVDYQRMRAEYIEALSVVIAELDKETEQTVIFTVAEAEKYIEREVATLRARPLAGKSAKSVINLIETTVLTETTQEEKLATGKFCTHCGTAVCGNDKFCSNCGHKL